MKLLKDFMKVMSYGWGGLHSQPKPQPETRTSVVFAVKLSLLSPVEMIETRFTQGDISEKDIEMAKNMGDMPWVITSLEPEQRNWLLSCLPVWAAYKIKNRIKSKLNLIQYDGDKFFYP